MGQKVSKLRMWNNDGELLFRDLTKKGKRKIEYDILRERPNNVCRIGGRVH